jgi:hypothetical protein
MVGFGRVEKLLRFFHVILRLTHFLSLVFATFSFFSFHSHFSQILKQTGGMLGGTSEHQPPHSPHGHTLASLASPLSASSSSSSSSSASSSSSSSSTFAGAGSGSVFSQLHAMSAQVRAQLPVHQVMIWDNPISHRTNGDSIESSFIHFHLDTETSKKCGRK